MVALKNVTDGGDPTFVDATVALGLLPTGSAVEAVVGNDFNNDGDPDLYLGRPTSEDGLFWQAQNPEGTDLPVNRAVTIKLDAGTGNNAFGIGSRVTLKDASGQTVLASQEVDGGSGRGTQRSVKLDFGLGDYDQAFDIVIDWTGGYQQIVEDVAALSESEHRVLTVVDATAPEILTNSPYWKYRVYTKPGGVLDVAMIWLTDYATDFTLEEVEITSTIDGYLGTFTPANSGVSWTIYRDNVRGGYYHEMRLLDRPCRVGETYSFVVTSATDTHSDTWVVPGTLTVTACSR